ncbi:ExbD/TolR family protein [Bremerella sp. T1]|uniref:ExbD/TolR family protein n=1 Tax=Bremerella sp. TYQ1 TaxID=3119568 RepID=UPI001CCE37D9|nr:biopolymer transporter ExbD [Bremerella volcania]UBM37501.1 biopolymer transporter ExbD [Bremerella volcania]
MSNGVFRFRCPACSDLLSASVDMVGGTTFCSNCDTRLEVPKPARLSDEHDQEELLELTAEDVVVPQPKPREAENVVAQEQPVSFQTKRDGDDGELDLTPMVDVTFLLLIFFMVTASFQIQKSMEVPAPKDNAPSAVAQEQEEPEDDPDNILVRIDSFNTYFVGCAAWDQEREAPSEQELYRQIREARASNPAQPPRTLLVIAHVEALHEKVVTALDAGADAGVDSIRLMSTEEDL